LVNNSSKLFKQRLRSIHVSVGIVFSLFIYISIFFGIFAIYLPYIQIWEKPSRHFETIKIENIDYNSMLEPFISNPNFPKNNITIELPGYENDPALKIIHDDIKSIVFNPKTKNLIKDEEGKSELAVFLNHMHYGRPYKPFGYILFGLVAIAVMFLIIGGILQSIFLKYKSRAKNKQAKYSKWHRKILIWFFTPFVIITLTGAVMNIGYITSDFMTYIASKGQTSKIGDLINPYLNTPLNIVEKKNDRVPMIPFKTLIKKAQEINPDVNFYYITLTNWNDSSALARFSGYNSKMPFLNGIYNEPSVVLSGSSGKLVENIKVLDVHWSKLFVDSIYFLHMLFNIGFIFRSIMAIIMALCGIAIVFGVMLWLEKKAKKYVNKDMFYHWFEKLSISIIIGVIPSTGLIFLLQWILPFDMEDRLILQRGLFLIFWLFTLIWAFYRTSSYFAIKELLFMGGLFFILTPLLHFYILKINPFELYLQNSIILNVDISLFIFACILFIFSYKIPKSRNKLEG